MCPRFLLAVSQICMACGQTVNSDQVLDRVRRRLLSDLEHLQRSTCVQTITREYQGVKALRRRTCAEIIQASRDRKRELPMFAWDRLRLDVSVTPTKEIFSWAGASKFEEGEISDLVNTGSMGTGDFGSFLGSILNRPIGIIYRGPHIAGARTLAEFIYDMPKNVSGYRVKTSAGKAITAHEGSFLIDPPLNDIVRLTVRTAELPPESGACQAISEIDYGRWNIAGPQTLIPRQTKFRVIYFDGMETLNITTYTNCRAYVGESTVRFEEPEASPAPNAPGRPATPAAIPAFLELVCRITTPIDSDTSAAGDALDGILLKPILDQAGSVLAPAGAPIHARLLKLTQNHLPKDRFEIGVHFESIELNGKLVPLAANEREFPFYQKKLRLPKFESTWITR